MDKENFVNNNSIKTLEKILKIRLKAKKQDKDDKLALKKLKSIKF